MQKTPTLSKKYKYACIFILTFVKQAKKIIMHAYVINMRRIKLNKHKMVLLQMVLHKNYASI